MIDPKHELSITRQAQVLGISRAAVYYVPRPISEADLALQRRIDELHLEHPFAGARMLRDMLRREGIEVGRTAAAGGPPYRSGSHAGRLRCSGTIAHYRADARQGIQ